MRTIKKLLLLLVVGLIIGTWFYARNVWVYFDPVGETYLYEDEKTGEKLEISFKEDNIMKMRAAEADEEHLQFDIDFKYMCFGRPKYFFNTYFQGKSVLSLRKLEHEGRPVDLAFLFVEGKYGNPKMTKEYTESDFPNTFDEYVYFEDDGMWFQGRWLNKVDSKALE